MHCKKKLRLSNATPREHRFVPIEYRQNDIYDDPCDLENRFTVVPFDTRTREFYIGGNEKVNAFPQINSMTHRDITKHIWSAILSQVIAKLHRNEDPCAIENL